MIICQVGATGEQRNRRARVTNLKQRREAAGLTQAELARRCGCSANYIWDLENGRRPASNEMEVKFRRVLGEKAVPIQRTPDEQFLYELWCERYGGSRAIVLQRG